MCSAREDIIILQVQGQGFSSDSPLQALLLGQRKQGIRYPKASPTHLPKSTPICGSLHQVIQVFLPNDFRHAYVVPAYGDWSFLAACPSLADLEKLNVASSAACWLHPIIASHCFTQSSYKLLVQPPPLLLGDHLHTGQLYCTRWQKNNWNFRPNKPLNHRV